VIPKRKTRSRETPGRPINFDRESYKKRHVVENVIGKGKEFRRVAFRFDRHTESYAAMIYATLIKKILAL
jgi:transposase